MKLLRLFTLVSALTCAWACRKQREPTPRAKYCPPTKTLTSIWGRDECYMTWSTPRSDISATVTQTGGPTRGSYAKAGRHLIKYKAHTRHKTNNGFCSFYVTCTVTRCSFTFPTWYYTNVYALYEGRFVHRDCTRGNVYGSTCTFKCAPGFELTSPWTTTYCQSNGVWTKGPPYCKRSSCVGLIGPANGGVTCSNGYLYRSRCTYTCEDGFAFNTGYYRTRTCSTSSSGLAWTPHFTPLCLDVVDPEIVCPADTSIYADASGMAHNARWDRATARDNVDGIIETRQIYGPNIGSSLTENQNYVIGFEAKDSAGNVGSCSFTVTILPSLCPALPQTPHCTNGRRIGSECIFLCDEGYLLVGEELLTCQEDQQWTAEEPSCEDVVCPEISTPANGNIECTAGSSYNSQCTLRCDEGFEVLGSNPRKCQSNAEGGYWTGADASCARSACQIPTLEDHAIITNPNECLPRHKNPPGTVCRFSCESGYHLVGETAMECTNDGEWNVAAPRCDVLQCNGNELPVPPNGYKNGCDGSKQDVGTVCKLGCDEGFFPVSEIEVTCEVTQDGRASWSDSPPTCEEPLCPYPDLPRNGDSVHCSFENDAIDIDSQFVRHQTVCTTNCSHGFTENGDSERVCQQDGEWNGTPLSCADEDPPDVEKPADDVRVAGERSNYVVVDFAEWETYIEEHASDVSGPVIINFVKICSQGTDRFYKSTSFYEGAHAVTYSVADQAGNTADVTFQITVKVIHCGELVVPHSHFSGGSACSTGVVLGTMCTVSCNSGYHLTTGDAAIEYTCSRSDPSNFEGQWTPSDTSIACEANQCIIQSIENGNVYGCAGESVDYATTCNFVCRRGYRDGSQTNQERTCMEDGTWSGEDMNCQVVTCPGPLVLTGGKAAPANVCEQEDRIPYNTTCTLSCDNEFSLGGLTNYASRCLEDGTWSIDISRATCRDFQPPRFTKGCPRTIRESTDWNQRTKLIDYAWPVAEDNSGNVTVTRVFTSGYNNLYDERPGSDVFRAEDGSGNIAECEVLIIVTVRRCSVLQAPSQGSSSNCSRIYGGKCGFQCNHGYILAGEQELVCGNRSTGEVSWSSAPPSCEAVRCPALEVNPNVTVVGCSGREERYGKQCFLGCPYGYKSVGSSVSTCQADGTWDTNDFACEVTRCPSLQVPSDKNITVLPAACMSNPVFELQCSLTCTPGYELRPYGRELTRCTGEGTWTRDVADARCVDYVPPTFSNCSVDGRTLYVERGQRTLYVDWMLEATDNSGVAPEVTCDPDGTALPLGGHSVQCTATDTADNAGHCNFYVIVAARRCPEFPPQVQAIVREPCSNLYGQTCRFQCSEGYELVGSGGATCERNNSRMFWDYENNIPSCKLLTCPPVTGDLLSEFVRINPLSCQDNGRMRPGDTCQFYCSHSGFEIQPPVILTCLQNASWNHDIEGLHIECIDVSEPYVTFCPDDKSYVITYDNPVAIVNFTEPTAADNSATVLRRETIPPNLTTPFMCTADTVLSYTFYDGRNNSVTCTFKVYVIDNVVPRATCPENLEITTTTIRTVVEWEEPTFSAPGNDMVNFTCSQNSGDEFSIGRYSVHCETTDPSYKKKAFCRFDVAISALECMSLPAPLNGAMTCTTLLVGKYCIQGCNEYYTIPYIDHYSGAFVCGVDRIWIPLEVLDCNVKIGPRAMRVNNLIQYYSGECTDPEVQEKLRMDFVKTIQNEPTIIENVCADSSNCTIDNIQIMCGIVRDVGRGKRTVQDEAYLSENRDKFSGRIEKVLNQQKPVYNHARHRRSDELFEVVITFDLLVDVPQNSPEGDQDPIDTAVDVLYEISDGIAARVEDGTLIPEADGITLTAHDTPVIYFLAEPKCEIGAARTSDRESCAACPRGTFGTEDGCVLCPIGTYQDKSMQTRCEDCPEGYSTLNEATVNSTDCLEICPPGTISETGLAPCSDCGVDFYQPAMGGSECIPCPEGTRCSHPASYLLEQCIEECPSGSFSTTGLVPCTFCSVLEYQNSPGQTFCYPCADGYMSSIEGSTEEEQCSELTGVGLCGRLPCQNGGICVPGFNDFNCSCENGFTGPLCDVPPPLVCQMSCQNDGSCVIVDSLSVCLCPWGYEGTDCSVPVDPCSSVHCENRGACERNGADFQCICPNEFTGKRCEHWIDPCDPDPCDVNGQCNSQTGACECQQGFTGEYCREEINECSSNPCINGGSCVDYVGYYTCACPNGYSGVHCEMDIDLCSGNPCPENATCIERDTAYYCICPPGKSGRQCDEDSHPCDDGEDPPCRNDAICVVDGDSYHCDCADGFGGVHCEEPLEACHSQPCSNGGTCYRSAGGFACLCPHGFTDVDCTKPVDPCESAPCANGGICVEDEESGGFSCRCTSFTFTGPLCEDRLIRCINGTCMNGGYCADEFSSVCICPRGGGPHCEVEDDPCSYAPCHNNGTCINEGDGIFRCQCKPTFQGDMCEQQTDFCETSPCQNNASCVQTEDISYCHCRKGFEGVFCEVSVDACRNISCNNGSCIADESASFYCDCSEGYYGEYCEIEINECISNPCLNSISCENLPGRFRCVCSIGWEGELCDRAVDRCGSNPCSNGGQCHAEGQGYRCQCLLGFGGDHCQDNIDECASDPCISGKCIDGIDGFTCKCPKGSFGKNCGIFGNPCIYQKPCKHGGLCILQGSHGYHCECPRGTGGEDCSINYDDCGGHSCQNGGTCNDEIGGYSCTCPTGFNGTFCETAIAPCEAQPCQNDGSCHERGGGMFCTCPEGFVGFLCEVNQDECESSPCHNGASCVDGIMAYTCICSEGFTGERCMDNIDDCVDNECQNSAECIDGVATYICDCNHGFYGTHCEFIFGVDFDFKVERKTPAVATERRPVHELTVSLWIRSSSVTEGCIIDYRPPLHDLYNADASLVIKAGAGHLDVSVFGETFRIGEPVTNDRWHHIAVTWDSLESLIQVFVDGNPSVSHILEGPIPILNPESHGMIHVGPCGSPDNASLYNGYFSRINVWDAVLPEGLIEEMARECSLHLLGNLLNANDILVHLTKHLHIIAPSQCEAIDDCASSPCSELATCTDGYGEYRCLCPSYLTGPACEEDVVDCIEGSCANGGTCVDGTGNFTCLCLDGTTGPSCELDVVDGQFGNWSLWTDCSKTCGGGNRSRERSCDNPFPVNGGLPCDGEDYQSEDCNVASCPVCQPPPEVRNGYLNCTSTDDWDYFCTHHCHVGFTATVRTQDNYYCGERLGFQWNVDSEENPNLRVPDCIEPEQPLEVDVEYTTVYPELVCSEGNKKEIFEQIKESVNFVVGQLSCHLDGSCDLQNVTAVGCPEEQTANSTESDDGSQLGNVTKVVKIRYRFDPMLESDTPEQSAVGVNLKELVDRDITEQGALISVDNKIRNVDPSSYDFPTTPVCRIGTTQHLFRCAPCESGSYWFDGVCLFCPSGTYQPQEGTTSCNDCPEGTGTHRIGAVSVNECVKTG